MGSSTSKLFAAYHGIKLKDFALPADTKVMKNITAKYQGVCKRCYKGYPAGTKLQLCMKPEPHWVHEDCSRAPDMPEGSEPKVIELGDYSTVYGFFLQAKKSGLKAPRMTFLVDGMTFGVSLSGKTAKEPGVINVKSEGSWYGRIYVNGRWEFPHYPDERMCDALMKLGYKTGATITEYGQRTGVCCFCNATLTDAYSQAVGYGPVCALAWGLPWGGPPAESDQVMTSFGETLKATLTPEAKALLAEGAGKPIVHLKKGFTFPLQTAASEGMPSSVKAFADFELAIAKGVPLNQMLIIDSVGGSHTKIFLDPAAYPPPPPPPPRVVTIKQKEITAKVNLTGLDESPPACAWCGDSGHLSPYASDCDTPCHHCDAYESQG